MQRQRFGLAESVRFLRSDTPLQSVVTQVRDATPQRNRLLAVVVYPPPGDHFSFNNNKKKSPFVSIRATHSRYKRGDFPRRRHGTLGPSTDRPLGIGRVGWRWIFFVVVRRQAIQSQTRWYGYTLRAITFFLFTFLRHHSPRCFVSIFGTERENFDLHASCINRFPPSTTTEFDFQFSSRREISN